MCSIVIFAGRGFAQSLAIDAAWIQFLGLAVLVGSTAFALWARFSLGTSWSMAPEVGGDRRLRTSGPYAVTRHPIYTGLLGMLLGSALLGGLGQGILLIVAGLIVFEVKIRMEEELLLKIFPDAYPAYRRRVPQLIPGLGALNRRRHAGLKPAKPGAGSNGGAEGMPGSCAPSGPRRGSAFHLRPLPQVHGSLRPRLASSAA